VSDSAHVVMQAEHSTAYSLQAILKAQRTNESRRDMGFGSDRVLAASQESVGQCAVTVVSQGVSD